MAKTEIYNLHPLFEDVQLGNVLEDGKTFVDCIPKADTDKIAEQYLQEKNKQGFDLKRFVLDNFDLPVVPKLDYESNTERPVEENIKALWDMLTREPVQEQGSLLNLPYKYIVPGGRFREIYYWDSYFTMLGLKEHGRVDLIESMINNFAFLIKTYGHIPNGNRRYYLSRSQPPFFALMVNLLEDIKQDDSVLVTYLDELETEYNFWQKGEDEVKVGEAVNRVAKMQDGEMLNRYFDNNPHPRQESYSEDVHVSKTTDQSPGKIFTNLRAGAESGWDFSSRWFADGETLATIHTTDIIPVDLNCLLYMLEQTISKANATKNNEAGARQFADKACNRKKAILNYCWNQELNFFCDYDLVKQEQKKQVSAAGMFPLFVNIASPEQAKAVAEKAESLLLKPGGIVTTTVHSGQQWDAPNGWAPLQWIAFAGFTNYQQYDLANKIADRWLFLNEKVFKETGKLMEKYNVEDIDKPAGGGEYAGQDGFGWTNGIYMAFKKNGHVSAAS